MITDINQLITKIKNDLFTWKSTIKPWFRGESGDKLTPLCPKISSYSAEQENYFLQSFRRRAIGLPNTPNRDHVDRWLFLAQHYGVPTRLLDWTEGALIALFFAINSKNQNPRLYMLNPHRLNALALGKSDNLNFPLSWVKAGHLYVSLAWSHRTPKKSEYSLSFPIAFPAILQDQRMISQRSCFTIHGLELKPITEILSYHNEIISDYLFEYKIDPNKSDQLLKDLSILGISASTAFPDLDHLVKDLEFDIENL